MQPEIGSIEKYFKYDTNIGVIGHGETVETCFVDAARNMFALMQDIEKVHLVQIITFEFEEADIDAALVMWLNLVLKKAQEHQLVFGDFRLKREGKSWKATVSGEKRNQVLEGNIDVKSASFAMVSVAKIDYLWEARCVVECS